MASALAALIVTGCFEAPIVQGRDCGPDNPCPMGFECARDSTCQLGAQDDPGPDGGTSTSSDGGTGPCAAGEVRGCYPGPAPTRNVGLCADGTETCEAGVWGACRDARLPEPEEQCDGRDNNCDGRVDEGCACAEGATQPCYAGPDGTEGVAGCRAGTQTCTGGRWSACSGEVLPAAEVCNDRDDDCNGVVDDGDSNGCGGVCSLSNPLGAACDAASADDLDTCLDDTFTCAGINDVACTNAGEDGDGDNYSLGADACGGDCQDANPSIHPAVTEVCNGFDDNCDDNIDEGCGYDPTACEGPAPARADTTASAPVPPCNSDTYYVAPDGNDGNDGQSPGQALATINQALNFAQPGDCVRLESGEYLQDVTTVRPGTANAPIRITGPRGAIVRGSGYRVFLVRNDYIFIDGFTIDGLFGNSAQDTGYREILMEIYSETANVGVTGVVVANVDFRNAQRGCLYIRYFSSDHEVRNNTFEDCDMTFQLTGNNPDVGNAVGIGTYFGSVQNNPTPDPDLSARNWIHNNEFVRGGRCVAISDEAEGNVIENNDCVGGHLLRQGAISIRGNWNLIRNNNARNEMGSGLQFPWDPPSPAKCNDVVQNTFNDNPRSAIYFDGAPQGLICGNTALGNPEVGAGPFAYLYDPTAPCP